MSFALTRFKAYGIRASGATRQHVQQVAVLGITAANTDTAMDIQTLAGTFWTAAIANATYGSLATAARTKIFTDITGVMAHFVSAHAPALFTRLQVTTATTGTEYNTALTAGIPGFAFVSGSAPTAFTLTITWLLKDGYEAIVADYGAQLT